MTYTEDKQIDERSVAEKRLAGLVLERYGDIEFEGNPTEVAYQFCRAIQNIKANLETVGLRAMDPERMAVPSSGSGGAALPDAEYAAQVRRLADLERVAKEVFEDVDDIKRYVWTELRFALTQTVDAEGCSHFRTASTREVSRKIRELYGIKASKSTVHQWARKLDEKLDKALEKRGWTI